MRSKSQSEQEVDQNIQSNLEQALTDFFHVLQRSFLEELPEEEKPAVIEALNLITNAALRCIAGDTPQVVYSNSSRESIHTSLRDELYRLNLGHIAQLLVESDHWQYHLSPKELKEGLSTEPQFFTQLLVEWVRPLYAGMQPILDNTAPSEAGFNNHELETHILATKRIADIFIKDIEMSNEEANKVITAIMFHDVGNLLSRKSHSLLSVVLMTEIFGQEIMKEEQFRTILEAIYYHDEETAVPLDNKLAAIASRDINGRILDHSNRPEIAQIVAKSFLNLRSGIIETETLILRLADKIHSGVARVNNTRMKSNSSEALDIDKHFAVNLPLMLDDENPENNIELSKNDGELDLAINLDFAVEPKPNSPHSLTFQKRRTQRREIFFSKDVREKYKKEGVSYFDSIVDGYINLYRKRIALLVFDAFTLFPNLNSFTYSFSDKKPFTDKQGQIHTNEPRILFFTRADVLTEVYDQLNLDIANIFVDRTNEEN